MADKKRTLGSTFCNTADNVVQRNSAEFSSIFVDGRTVLSVLNCRQGMSDNFIILIFFAIFSLNYQINLVQFNQ